MERIYIQWEYSYFYPAIASSNHVTNWGKQSLKFKTDVAMMGKLGFDIVVSKLKPDELAFCKDAIKTYKQFSDVIWHGDLYRLQSPWANDVAAVMYADASKKTAIMFNYLVNNRYAAGSNTPIRLKGLEAAKIYTVTEVNLYPGSKSTLTNATYSGNFLMTVGINPDVHQGRESVLLAIEEKK